VHAALGGARGRGGAGFRVQGLGFSAGAREWKGGTVMGRGLPLEVAVALAAKPPAGMLPHMPTAPEIATEREREKERERERERECHIHTPTPQTHTTYVYHCNITLLHKHVCKCVCVANQKIYIRTIKRNFSLQS